MLTCAAWAVLSTYAPPATIFRQAPQDQMPTTDRFTESLPQKTHVYFECWLISIFFTCLRREAPYRTPYLPVMPAFLVRCEGWRGERVRADSSPRGTAHRARAAPHLVDHLSRRVEKKTGPARATGRDFP